MKTSRGGVGRSSGGTFFDRLYSRYRSRYLRLYYLAMGVPYLAVPGIGIWLFARYENLSLVEGSALFAAYAISALFSSVWAFRAVWQRAQPVRAWIETGADGSGPETWALAVSLPERIRRALFVRNTPVAFVVIVTMTEIVVSDGLAPLIAIGIGTLIIALYLSTSNHLMTVVGVRPVLRDISEALPDDFEPELPQMRLARSLLAELFTGITLGCVAAAALHADRGTGSQALLENYLLSILVACAVTLLLATMLTERVLGPVRELTQASERVSASDLSQGVPLIANDEQGRLLQSFNSMLAGLRDRLRLSTENARLLEEVRASRARIIAASDAERKRVERNLHDGAQQRLVALTLELRMLEAKAKSSSDPELSEAIAAATENLSGALGELRELARGLHPQILSTDGLRPALQQLAGRAPVPVEVETPDERYPDPVESTAYFVVSEALANVQKYAQASEVEVSIERRDGALHVTVEDDGVGGADPDSGSGLSGLRDRVAALDGSLEVESDRGGGTKVRAELPLGGVDG